MVMFMGWISDKQPHLFFVYPLMIVLLLVRRIENKEKYSLKYLGLCLSSTVPGFLITSSFDETVKIWDIENGNVTFVAERKFQTVNFSICCIISNDYL